MVKSVTQQLLFDVTGLLYWYAYRKIPTGIQRVTERILSAPAIVDRPAVAFVARMPGSSRLFTIDPRIIRELAADSTRARAIGGLRQSYSELLGQAPLFASLRDMGWRQWPWSYVAMGRLGLGRFWDARKRRGQAGRYSLPTPLAPACGGILVNLGDFWGHSRQGSASAEIGMRYSVKQIQMIHDLFPLQKPEWSHPWFRKSFVRQLEELTHVVDGWIVASDFVHGELQEYLAQAGQASRPVARISMGWNLEPVTAASREYDRGALRRLGLVNGSYFLQVGTIEPRKNHAAVVRAVERLRRKHGSSLPTCVFAGIHGWGSRDLVRRLVHARVADGAIRWLKDVDELDLVALYRGALFTVYPSLMEGWGLPVQESLSYGVPCIASNADAIREAGRDLAVYVDPNDDDQLTEAIEYYLVDPSALPGARRKIATTLTGASRLPGWNEAALGVVAGVGRLMSGDQ